MIRESEYAYRSETHALEAVIWATKPYPATPELTNWQVWMEKLKQEASKPYKFTIMRNQVSLGMNNNYYPTLSRFALMAEPRIFGNLINPRHVSALDSKEGIEMLNDLFVKATGYKPKIYDWHNAKRRAS